MVDSFTCVAIQKSVDMSVQRLSAGEIALLVCNNCDGNEYGSEDEAIGDFTASDGCSYVLSGDSLVQSSRTTLSLPLPAERDSLLLCETSDLEDELEDSREDEYTAVDLNEDAGTTSNNADSDNEAEDSDSKVDNSSDFEFVWCDIDANFVEPDLADFQEPVGVNSEASSAKSPLECFKLFLHRYCYPF